jgi:hypothetical protein
MKVDSLPEDTAEIETGMAEKSSLGTKQIIQMLINAYLHLPFFLSIIL